MIEKYTFDIVAPRIKKKLILVKNINERREHVVLKLLAYLLFYEPRLKIECDIGMHYRLDLVIEGDHGVPELWIDCGQVSLEKADKLSRKLKSSRVIFIKESAAEMERFRKTLEKKVEHAARIEYLSFDSGFVAGIAEHLDRSNEFTLYAVDETTIGVTTGGNVFETHLHKVLPASCRGNSRQTDGGQA